MDHENDQSQPADAGRRPAEDAPVPAPGRPPHQAPAPGPWPPAGRQPAGVGYPQPPAPRRGGFGRGFGLGAGAGLGVGLALLVVSLVGSILSGLVLLSLGAAGTSMAGRGQTGAQGVKTVWGPASATQTLRAIPVRGAILTHGGSDGFALQAATYGYEVADVLDDLTDKDADGVVLMMNTPGGSVTGSQAMADAVDRYRQRTGKKVYAFVEEMSASGGMWTMAGADRIIADHGATVGSIGVIMGPLERYRDVTSSGSLLTGEVTAREITAEYITAGRGKDAGQPYRDLTPEERQSFQGMVNRMYDAFVDRVATARHLERDFIVQTLGAQIFDPEQAREYGLIDDTMGRDAAMRAFAEASGLDPQHTRVVEATAPTMLAQLLGAQARPWGVAPAAEPVGGQPARATASICTDATQPLVWHGSMTGVCR